jgi:Uma2 family endonuclease
MATVLRLGPADHGRPMTLEEFLTSGWEEGYHYELIDGKVYVAPLPNLPEDRVEKWLFFKFQLYAAGHPGVLSYLTDKARVFVPGRRRATCPEPDVAAYRDFPVERAIRAVRWQDVSPFLVVEVLSADDPDKDLVRNVELYLQVPTIKEYWILDTRADPDCPSLRVHRRHGGRWHVKDVEFGETYTTRLLPGFRLVLDPRQ